MKYAGRLVAASLAAALALSIAHATATAGSFASIKTGVGYDSQQSRLLRETPTVSVLDWPVYVLAEYRDVSEGDRFEFRISPPDGSFTWLWQLSAPRSSWRYTFRIFVPLPGTSNEERTGTWQITASHRGQQNQAQLNVVPAQPGDLDAIRAEQEAKPNDFAANYRLGVAASMFGQDQLAVSSLRRAAQLNPQSPYPVLAVCRHHIRQGRKNIARQACAFARGLLMGRENDPLLGWLQSEVEKLLQTLE
jgi:hypothetical protein